MLFGWKGPVVFGDIELKDWVLTVVEFGIVNVAVRIRLHFWHSSNVPDIIYHCFLAGFFPVCRV